MQNFYYTAKTDLIFGEDAEQKVGRTLKGYGASKVILCYGQGSAVKSGLINRIQESLTDSKIEYILHGGISANPLKSHALQGAELAKANKVDFVLAVGGGSVADEAKLIAASLKNPNIWDYYLRINQSAITAATPMAVVLTIPAAGSEGSGASVIRDDDSIGTKFSIHSSAIRPLYAFINPRLCMTLPKNQIANGASDILAHLLERYFSPQDHVTVSDNLLGAAIKSLLEVAPKVYNDNANYDYWSELCILGTLAHNGMLDMGRTIQDWGTHIIENKVLSGVHNIAHGEGLAILFPAWLKLMSSKNPNKLIQFATEVMNVTDGTPQERISKAIEKLTAFYKMLNLPTTLREVKLEAENVIPHLDTYFNESTRLGGYGELTLPEMKEIIELAR